MVIIYSINPISFRKITIFRKDIYNTINTLKALCHKGLKSVIACLLSIKGRACIYARCFQIDTLDTLAPLTPPTFLTCKYLQGLLYIFLKFFRTARSYKVFIFCWIFTICKDLVDMVAYLQCLWYGRYCYFRIGGIYHA